MEYRTLNDQIIVSLPITTPTGKVRVKRPVAGYAAEPVACRSLPMMADDYLEWQIAGSYAVEIKIAHKQRAVGNQAMIFVNLPLKYCQSKGSQPLIGRCADKSEKADYAINAGNVEMVFDTFVAFALASVSHRNDLKMIFEKL